MTDIEWHKIKEEAERACQTDEHKQLIKELVDDHPDKWQIDSTQCLNELFDGK